MNFIAIIKSLLDTDFYKFTMQQVFFNRFPTANGEYQFKLRNKGIKLSHIRHDLNKELDSLCELQFQPDELDFLDSLKINGVKLFKSSYMSMLKNFKLNRENIHIFEDNGDLVITSRGVLYEVMMFEVFILAIVNELYFRHEKAELDYDEGMTRFNLKMEKLNTLNLTSKGINPVTFFDFGTRRRFSRDWQEIVVKKAFKEYPTIFGGTSNVLLSKELGTMPIGTMAHEYLQAMQVLNTQGLVNSQKEALEIWLDEYRGTLAVALTDVIGMDSFLNDFDYLLTKSYDGTRHDSGDPVLWGKKQLKHYNSMNIDPKTKTLVFSDSLDVDLICDLYREFCKDIQIKYGWGTGFTNDVGFETINIVMKIVRCNGQPVVKISDSSGKTMCDDADYIRYVKHIFNLD